MSHHGVILFGDSVDELLTRFGVLGYHPDYTSSAEE